MTKGGEGVTPPHSMMAYVIAEMQIRPEWKDRIEREAKSILLNKSRYQAISEKTGVPWDVIAVIHYRESDCDFRTHLHNGDSLKTRTHNVPRGRPLKGSPPFSFEESAIDALEYDGFTGKKDWSIGITVDRLERYNGIGYRMKGKPSPYLWSGTTYYERGKYTSDGSFDHNAVDKQIGVVPLLLTIRAMDTKPIAPSKPTESKTPWYQSLLVSLLGLLSKRS